MAGLFVVLLVILAVQYWYVAAGAIALWLLWCLVLVPWWRQVVRQSEEQLRHQRARAEIDAVTAATRRAMVDATRERRS
jgi:type VI protein secretion system component VasK